MASAGARLWIRDRGTPSAFLVPTYVFGALALLAAADGGFDELAWPAAGAFLLCLLLVVRLALPAMTGPLPALTKAAVALFLGFSAWSFLSVAWAEVPGDAWTGANRTLVYVATFSLVALWPWRPAIAVGALALYSLGVTAVVLRSFIAASRSDDPDSFFVGRLLAEPAGYHNANAALMLSAFWPAALLASRRETPVVGRAVLLGCAGILLEVAVLSQSRGSLFAFPAALTVGLLVVPRRARTLLTLAPVGLVTFLAREPLLNVYRAARDGGLPDALDEARTAVILSGALLIAWGLVTAVLDRRLSLPPRVARYGSRVVGACALAGLLAVLVAVLPNDPAASASAAWRDFKTGQYQAGETSHFATGLGSNRYDFWRVGLDEFAREPLLGIGADNFAVPYLRNRRSEEEPRYPHSLEVQVLSQTGLVGATLFAGFLAAAIAGALRTRWDGDGRSWPVAAIALTAFSYWVVHASGDWLWEFPGLTAPALAFVGLAAGLGRAPGPRDAGRRPGARFGTALAAAVVLAATTSLAAQWFAEREIRLATATWRRDPAAAYERLERARRLAPLSHRPDLIAGAIASRMEDWPRMGEAFQRALDRSPSSWYARLELALSEWAQGRHAAALRELAAAQELNPNEPAIELVRRRIRAGAEIDADALDRLFLDRVEARVG
jgi:hypothetical protein